MSENPKPRLFILGPQRAGTSVMLALARDVLGYACAPEGWIWGSVKALEDHFAAVRQELSDVEPREVAAFSIARLSTDALLDSYTAALLDLHAREWGDGPIADKTPGPLAIAAAPAIKRRLPAAKFVVMKRRGIENVQSQQRRFPDRPFDAACAMWSDSMRAWLAVRDELGEAALEVDQANLHRDANGVGERLADFLGATDAAPLADFFRRRFTEKTKPGDYGEDIDLRNAGWDADQMQQFAEICGGMMGAFGYSLAGDGATPSGLDLVAGAMVGRWIIAARNPRTVAVRRGGLELLPDRGVDSPVTLRMPAALTPGRRRQIRPFQAQ